MVLPGFVRLLLCKEPVHPREPLAHLAGSEFLLGSIELLLLLLLPCLLHSFVLRLDDLGELIDGVGAGGTELDRLRFAVDCLVFEEGCLESGV